MNVMWKNISRNKGWRLKNIGGFLCALLLGMSGILAGTATWDIGEVRAAGEVLADGAVRVDGAVREEAAGIVVRQGGKPAETGETLRTQMGGTPSLYATSAVLLDADSGRVLYGKNENAVMAMASTTKIMTCILVLEHVSPDETLSVSAYASSMPKVKLYIKKGEQYTVRDLLHSLMLESHNDSAVALAEHVGKRFLPEEQAGREVSTYSVEESKAAVAAFADLMNRKAAELGCENTWFITPNGLDATETFTLPDGSTVEKSHSTTAEELAKIMAYCIGESPKADEFLEITRRGNYSFSGNSRSYSCNNHNAFLQMMSGAISGKTGFTNKAGYCYVGALESEGRTFIVALLACGWPNNKSYKWSDTRELMQYGIDNFFYRSFSEEGVAFDESILKSIPVYGGCTDILGGSAYTDVEIVGRDGGTICEDPEAEGLLLAADENIQVAYSIKEGLSAPVKAGEVVGTIEYSVGETVYKREYIVTEDSVEKIDLNWCLEQILTRFFGLW